MPRRASSGPKPSLLLGVAAALAIAFFAGKAFLGGKGESRLSGATLDMRSVTENANSLRGNQYVVEGKVDEKLRWTSERGQVISLKVDHGTESEFLAIEIPPDLSSVNIEREQQYAFKIRFQQGGIAIAEGIERL
ncbi:MAG: hypothetical protein ACQKBU_11045 [Verrucomicrobiales bacterium]